MRKYSFLLTALLFFLGVTAVFGQGRSISGKVVDSESGDPIVGASVEIVDAQTGTSTDENGNFTVTMPEGYTKLKIENTSYATQTVVARDGMVVRLVATSETLTEVDVEVAMGTKKGKGYVGSAQMVSSETIEKRSPSDVTKALSGEVAGLQVVTSSGQPGVASTVRLRGVGSLNASSGVLYVVDGIPYGNDISAIDPSDIVSTTVLKDATATAMYGARGSDGVILITTKKGTAGTEGKIEVDLMAGANFRYLPMHDVITDPQQYMELSWLGLFNLIKAYSPGASNLQVGQYVNNRILWGADLGMPVQYNLWNTRDIINSANGKFNSDVAKLYEPENWYDHMFHTGMKTGVGVKISGGSDKTTYYTSVNFLKDEGYYIQSDFKRLTTLTNLDYAPKKWLTANFKMQYAYYTMNNVGQSTTAANNGFVFVNSIPPIYPVFQHAADGSVVQDKYLGGNAYDYGQYIGYARPYYPGINPAGALRLDRSFVTGHNLAVSNFLKFEFVKDLVFIVTNGYNLYMGDRSQLMNMYYGDGENVGRINYNSSLGLDFNTRQQLTYKKTFAAIHNFDMMLGHDFRNQEVQVKSGGKSELLKPNDIQLSNAVKMVSLEGSQTDYRSESYMGELRYNFDEKYFAIVNGSIYGSSYFAPGHRYGTFASAGASWNIHKELFMSEIRKKWLSNLKVKASFGTSGNDNIGNYNYYNMYALTNFDGLPGVLFGSIAEPNLTWETTYKFNTGIEFEIKRGRLYGEVEFYSNTTVNNLDSRTVAPSLGYSSVPINQGKYRSFGFEFMLKAHVIDAKNFDLNLRLTGARHNAIFLELPEEYVNGQLVEMVMNGNYAKGKSRGAIYTKTFLGVDPQTGWSVWRKYYDETTGTENAVLEPYRYLNQKTVDANGNIVLENPNAKLVSTVTSDYRQAAYEYIEGKLIYPNLYGGFGIDVSTYGFDISMAFDYIIGGYNYDAIYANLMGDGAIGTNNYHVDMLNTWSHFQTAEHNKTTQVPILYSGQGYATANSAYYADWSNSSSTRFLTSNTGLRLSSVRVAYNFPKKMLEKIKLNNLSVWVSGDNLMVLSARRGYNPFTYLSGGNSSSQYAPLSTVVGGVKFSF